MGREGRERSKEIVNEHSFDLLHPTSWNVVVQMAAFIHLYIPYSLTVLTSHCKVLHCTSTYLSSTFTDLCK